MPKPLNKVFGFLFHLHSVTDWFANLLCTSIQEQLRNQNFLHRHKPSAMFFSTQASCISSCSCPPCMLNIAARLTLLWMGMQCPLKLMCSRIGLQLMVVPGRGVLEEGSSVRRSVIGVYPSTRYWCSNPFLTLLFLPVVITEQLTPLCSPSQDPLHCCRPKAAGPCDQGLKPLNCG